MIHIHLTIVPIGIWDILLIAILPVSYWKLIIFINSPYKCCALHTISLNNFILDNYEKIFNFNYFGFLFYILVSARAIFTI